MALVDFILNLAGLLLWLSWRAAKFDPLAQAKASTLAGTLKITGRSRSRGWVLLAAVAGLLVVRAIFYWQVGPALDWTPTLDLTVTALPFRSDYFVRVLLFSVLSFGRALGVVCLWMVFLAILKRGATDTDPLRKLTRVALGRLARWPWPLLLLLALALGTGVWMTLQPLLARLGIGPRTAASAQVFQQGLLVTAREFLTLRYLFAVFLVAHLLHSYVYFGSYAAWDSINDAGRTLLRPLRWLPLRLGRVDFAPVVGIALVFLLSEMALRYLPKLNPR